MKKSIEKLKVRIDQNLNRAEKSELLNEDLMRIEEKVHGLKTVCHSVSKKLSETNNNKGGSSSSDGAGIEKRIRKTTDFTLGQTIQENGRKLFTRKDETSFLGTLLSDSGHLLNDLAANQIQYEIEVEKLVINQLQMIMDGGIPAINKEKRNLERLVLELDTVKARLLKINEEQQPQREERLQEDLHEIQGKVDQTRDGLAALMLQFLAKEPEIGRILLTYFKVKKEYHSHVAEQIARQIHTFESLLDSCPTPVYGCDIRTHLRKSRRKIATPLQLCVCRLLSLGLNEEGLFRIAASAVKVKHVKGLFDAGEWPGHALYQITDHHVFTGALKTYLRELPIPILLEGGIPYSNWLKVQGIKSGIRDLIRRLPPDIRINLRYLLKFLQKVAEAASENKMTISNLSIVMAPNLIWNNNTTTTTTTTDNNSDETTTTTITVEETQNMSDTQVLNGIVETLLDNVDWFFETDTEIDYFEGLICSGSFVTVASSYPTVATPPPVAAAAVTAPSRAPVPTPRGSKGSTTTNKPVIPAKPQSLHNNTESSTTSSTSTTTSSSSVNLYPTLKESTDL